MAENILDVFVHTDDGRLDAIERKLDLIAAALGIEEETWETAEPEEPG